MGVEPIPVVSGVLVLSNPTRLVCLYSTESSVLLPRRQHVRERYASGKAAVISLVEQPVVLGRVLFSTTSINQSFYGTQLRGQRAVGSRNVHFGCVSNIPL
jgi:hypothetical protein